MNKASPHATREVALKRPVQARLVPLSLLVFFTVTLGAPTALLLARIREVRAHAEITASKAAALIAREARLIPDLWEYNTPKLVDHLSAYRQRSGVKWIVVTNRREEPLHLPKGVTSWRAMRRANEEAGVIWSAAPIHIGRRQVGHVWVAESISRAGGVVFLTFGALGLVLAFLVYWIPVRVVGTAEGRITQLVSELESSSQALSHLNRTLEDKVTQRSSALKETLEDLQAKERRLRELSRRALRLQESERRAIGRELHDETGQSLTAIRINLQLMEERARKEDGLQELQHLAANTLDLLDTSLSEVRRLVARLGPAILDEMGFVDALRRLCDGLEERTNAEVTLKTPDTMPSLSGPMETALYRMVQEALTNVARHAEATSVELRLSYEPDHERLSLGISDNGRGFDAQRNTPKKGRGLAGIQERAELLGGEMEVHASRGEGVTLHITIPVPASPGP